MSIQYKLIIYISFFFSNTDGTLEVWTAPAVVQTLQHLCRVSVRDTINTTALNNEEQSITDSYMDVDDTTTPMEQAVQQIPLPRDIKSFLLFSDIPPIAV